MKTLVNKHNPAIRIIADTLLSDSFNYITGFCSVPKSDWALVEEESEKKEQTEVDLEDIIRVEFGTRAKVEDGRRCVKLNWDKFSILARHFYELGLKARKED